MTKDYFSHNSFDGESFSIRLKRESYERSIAGENVTCRPGSRNTPGSRFDAWMESPGHKANTLKKRFREISMGVEEVASRYYSGVKMYTLDFGTRRH